MSSFELYVLRAAPSDFFARADPADRAMFLLPPILLICDLQKSTFLRIEKKENRSPLGGSRGHRPLAENRVFNMQKPMFLRCRRDRLVNSAISKISSYINPAQTRNQKHVLEAIPTAPIPQCHSPVRFLKQKAYVSYAFKLQNQNPRSKAQDTQNTKPTKHVLEATPTAPIPQCHSPVRFLKQKRVCFRMHSNSGIKTQGPRPRAQTPGPRLQAPGLQGRSPRPQGTGPKLRAPKSSVHCLGSKELSKTN